MSLATGLTVTAATDLSAFTDLVACIGYFD